MKHCKDLHILLTDGSSRYLDAVDMYSLTLIMKSPGSFQNISIALRIFLNIPVTSAGVEDPFLN